VTFLVERLGRRARLVVDHIVQIVSILYCAALVVATFQQARHVLRTGTTFVTMELPLWPAHLVVSIGLSLPDPRDHGVGPRPGRRTRRRPPWSRSPSGGPACGASGRACC